MPVASCVTASATVFWANAVLMDSMRYMPYRPALPTRVSSTSSTKETGSRQAVLIDGGEGRFAPRAVEIGRRGDGYVEIRAGLRAGERVVTAANFLIDAESNLKAALASLAAPPTDGEGGR